MPHRKWTYPIYSLLCSIMAVAIIVTTGKLDVRVVLLFTGILISLSVRTAADLIVAAINAKDN